MPGIRFAFALLFWQFGVVLLAADAEPSQSQREWMDDSGTFRVEATFLGFESPGMRLRRKDGLEILTPISRLSETDKAFLRRNCFSLRIKDGNEATAAAIHDLFTGPGEGLRGEYFRDMSLDEVGLVRTDETVNFEWKQHQPPYQGGKAIKEQGNGWAQHFAIRWSGLVVPRYSERYTISLEMDDGAALWLDDQLLIQQWKFEGNKPHTAQVELEAGRPYPIRIFYYNSWFGGGIKLRWASRSQPLEIIPRESLFLPCDKAVETAPPASQTSLAARISVQEISLPAPIKCNPDQNKPTLFLQPLPNEGFQLGWTDTSGRMHVTKLNALLEPVGKDAVTPNIDLRGMAVDADGGTTLLMAEPRDRMWLMHLDAAGKRLWHKCLVGEKGRAADQHYLDEHFSFTGRLAAAQGQVAAHFAHSWNTGKSGTHQGGYFTLVKQEGSVLNEEKWSVSHSLDQRVAFHNGCWFTLSAGDCYPKGIHFQNRTLGFGRVIYPEPAERDKFGNCGGFVNAHLAGLVPLGADLATAFVTKRDDCYKLYFLRLGADCIVAEQRLIAEFSAVEQQPAVKVARYGESVLVAWREGKEMRVLLVDSAGQKLGPAETLPHNLPVHDDMFMLPSGDPAWLSATNGESVVQLIRFTSP